MTRLEIKCREFAVANRALKQMREFLTEFGMTPSSRSRVWAKPLRSAETEEKRRKYGSRW